MRKNVMSFLQQVVIVIGFVESRQETIRISYNYKANKRKVDLNNSLNIMIFLK